MFEMSHLLISLHPHILISLVSCVLTCILTSSHPYFLCSCELSCIPHLYNLIYSGSCAVACIPESSYPQVRVCLLVTSHPHFLISLGSCTPGAFWYPRILTSSGSSVRKYLGNWDQIEVTLILLGSHT